MSVEIRIKTPTNRKNILRILPLRKMHPIHLRKTDSLLTPNDTDIF